MQTALDDLLQHLTRRAERLEALGRLVASFDALNHRQRSLLEHAIHHPMEGQSIEGHATSHRVHYLTARSDLARLEKLGLMHSRRVNKVKRYYPAEELVRSAVPARRALTKIPMVAAIGRRDASADAKIANLEWR